MKIFTKCKKCLIQSNHPYGIVLERDSICKSCVEQDKDDIFNIEILINSIKKQSKGRYDLLIPLKGNAEDFFVVETILQAGLNPICVFVNSYMNNEIAWMNVHTLIELYNLELRTICPNIKTYKTLVRYSLRKNGDIFSPYKLLKYKKIMELASQLNINYIISGENQVQKLSNKFTRQTYIENTKWSVVEHDVKMRLSEYFGPSLELNKSKYFEYDARENLSKTDIRWLFLSDFMNWDQLHQDLDMNLKGAFGQIEETTFDYNHRAGSSVFYRLHDLLRYKKYRSIKASDQLAREIRNNRILINDAKILESLYLHRLLSKDSIHSCLDDFLKWMNLESGAVSWLLKHFLDLRSEYQEIDIDKCEIVSNRILNNIKYSLDSIKVPSKSFCKFEKGISL